MATKCLTMANHELEWAPKIIDRSTPKGYEHVTELSKQGARIVDRIDLQLRDLIKIQTPKERLDEAELTRRVKTHLGGQNPLDYGRWVWYPWKQLLVHLLPREEFIQVRTNRNQNKITGIDQRKLAQASIGIVGLSVGNASARTLALEGVGRRFRLADFDHLELSNMNRLMASVAELGVNKAHLSARQMFEVDPYLQIEVFPDGIHDGNLDRFLGDVDRLDLLVEECDEPYLKLRIRERCRALGIPVLMETSDRGMLDVERYDLDGALSILHGRLGCISAKGFRELDRDEKNRIALEIVDPANASTDLIASMFEIDESINTWPQLGSAVALGSALVADTARRLLLGTFTGSGRFYVDLERLVASDLPASPREPTTRIPTTRKDCVDPREPISFPIATSKSVSRDEIRFLVRYATMAPSGGNQQPWKFSWNGDNLRVQQDRSHLSVLGEDGGEAKLAIGAAVENIEITAKHHGLKPHVAVTPESHTAQEFCCTIRFERGERIEQALFERIPERCTNRHVPQKAPLGKSDREILQSVAEKAEYRLLIVESDAELKELGRITGLVDRFRFLHQSFHEEFVRELRWSEKEAWAEGDGVDVATFEMSKAQQSVIRLMCIWPAMQKLKSIGGGHRLADYSYDLITNSSAVCFIEPPRQYVLDDFRLGRIMQRLWLTSAELGLAFQPMLTTQMFRIMGRPHEFTDLESEELQGLRSRFRACLGRDDGDRFFMFRLSKSPRPTARALRRPLEEVLVFADN